MPLLTALLEPYVPLREQSSESGFKYYIPEVFLPIKLNSHTLGGLVCSEDAVSGVSKAWADVGVFVKAAV